MEKIQSKGLLNPLNFRMERTSVEQGEARVITKRMVALTASTWFQYVDPLLLDWRSTGSQKP